MLSYPSDGAVALTEAGRALAQPTGTFRTLDDLHEAWYRLLDGGQRKILGALVDVYPMALSREELASRTGYEPAGGRFQNLLGSLRTLGVIDYPERGAVVATELLFPEGLR